MFQINMNFIFVHNCQHRFQNNFSVQRMSQQLDLQQYIQPLISSKTLAIPIEFQWPTNDLLCKQLTKLNSEHKYRIHYLGPRFINTQALHKKFSSNYNTPNLIQPMCQHISKYEMNMRNIIQSFYMGEKLRKNTFYKNTIFYRAFQGMNPTLHNKDQYIFDSVFQSGNLDCAIKVKDNQFDLFLRIDSNTQGHMNWFYFSIKNGSKKEKIKLNICNLKKRNTLYEKGMKPYIFSKQKYQKTGEQWKQQGKNIRMARKQLRYKFLYQKLKVPTLYSLTLEYEFQQQNDQVYFAYCIPYTYSQMLHFIHTLPQKWTKTYSLGNSLSGLKIPVLHITDFQETKEKKNIIITGRVHPCQSNSSHVLEGFIKFLCSQQRQAQELRGRVNFIIAPMINPDGVVLGNSRTGLMGKDLNRQFAMPKKNLFPQVCLIKNFVQKIQVQMNVLAYLDFHGHSCRKNTFFFGPPYSINQPQYYKTRVFPRLIQKINNSFRFYSCSYVISQNKKNTARAVMFEQFKIPYVYTVQSSIGYYYNSETRQSFPFCQKTWNKMGQSICMALSRFIVALDEYQQFLKQKKLIRQMKKQKQRQRQRQRQRIKKEQKQKGKAQDKSKANQAIKKQREKHQAPRTAKTQELKLMTPIKASQQLQLIELMQEVKQIQENATLVQTDQRSLSSDDHDEYEDLQPRKIEQLNNLVVESINARLQQSSRHTIDDSHLVEIHKKQRRVSNQISPYDMDQITLLNKIKQKPKSVHLYKQCQHNHDQYQHQSDINGFKTITVFHHSKDKTSEQDQLIFRTHRKIIKGFRLQKKKVKQPSRQSINRVTQRQSSESSNRNFYDCCVIHPQDIRRDTTQTIRMDRIKERDAKLNLINSRGLNKQATKLNLTFTQYVQQKHKNSLQKKFKPQNTTHLRKQSFFNLQKQDQIPVLSITSRMTKYIKNQDSYKSKNTQSNNQSLPSSFYGIKQNIAVKRNKLASLHRPKQDLKEAFNVTIRSFMK